jgi:hypothetical protein
MPDGRTVQRERTVAQALLPAAPALLPAQASLLA